MDQSANVRNHDGDKSDEDGKKRELSEDDDACPICFDPFSTEGPHRLVSLRCGHLYGKDCVAKWLRHSDRCPQCNKTARARDMRRIYGRRIVQVDTSEVEILKSKLRTESTMRREFEMTVAEMKTELLSLQRQLDVYKSINLNKPKLSSKIECRLLKSKRMEHSTGGRVLTFSYALQSFIFSRKSHSPLLKGYGIGLLDMNAANGLVSNDLPRPPVLHSADIKDIKCNYDQNPTLVLTAGFDGFVKAYDLRTGQCDLDLELDRPVWSCEFGSGGTHSVYCGTTNGVVSEYDLRQTSSKVADIYAAEYSSTPVNSIVPISSEEKCNRKGLLLCQLDCTTFVDSTGTMDRLFVGFRPICTSKSKSMFLITFRPSKGQTDQIHHVCELPGTTPDLVTTVNRFSGSPLSSVMSKTALFVLKGEKEVKPMVASYSHNARAIAIHDVLNDGKVVSLIKGPCGVTDICSATHGNVQLMASISPDSVDVFVIQCGS